VGDAVDIVRNGLVESVGQSNVGHLDEFEAVKRVIRSLIRGQGLLESSDEIGGFPTQGSTNGITGTEQLCCRVHGNVAIDSSDENPERHYAKDRYVRQDYFGVWYA